jgi:hypothetical protein
MSRRILVSVGLCVALLLCLAAAQRFSSSEASSGGAAAGVLVPLYGYPGQSWLSLIQAKEAYPSVPVIAVINPSDGPGTWQDPNFVSGIQELESVGITVVGYVPTDYASVPLWQAEQEISAYSQLYGLSGVFFDQMPAITGYESYYSTLTSYASSLGMWLTIGNPGSIVPSSYVGTVGIIVAYENSGLPTVDFLSGLSHDPSSFAFVSYDNYGLNSSFVIQAASDVGYVYITDGQLPDPYTTISTYISSLIATLAGTGSAIADPSIIVDAFDTSGNQIAGLFATVQSNGQTIASGFTPFSFSASSGGSYTVTIDNYGEYSFVYWATGSTSPSVTITPTTSSELAAFYST